MDNPEIHAIFGTMHRTKAGKTKNSAEKKPKQIHYDYDSTVTHMVLRQP
jgi:hypothetical protein